MAQYLDKKTLDNYEKVKFTMAKMDSTMNIKLKELYESLWSMYENLPIQVRNQEAYPYLLAASQKYENAEIKIMFCGKESNDWGHGDNEFKKNQEDLAEEATVDGLMKLFDFWINYNDGVVDDNGNYNPFWHFYAKKLKYLYEDRQKDRHEQSPVKIGCIANNIIKISHRGKGYNSDLNQQFIHFFKEEISILKPNIIIATIYNNSQRDLKYREILDDALGINSKGLVMDTKNDYKRFDINGRYIYVVRQPQGMNKGLKERILADIKMLLQRWETPNS